MTPEREGSHDPDLSRETASTIRRVADVLGVIAGVLFLIAFGIHLSRQGEVNVVLLGVGVLFLLFPFLMHRLVRPGR